MKLSRLLPPIFMMALAACSGNDVNDTLGLNKQAPDEFVVVSRPPLVIPPDFDLKPPRPGEEPPFAPTTEDQARQLLLGTSAAGASDTPTLDEFMRQPGDMPSVATAVDPVVVGEAPTAASSNFLKQAGADTADSNIRSELSTAKPPEKGQAESLYEEMLQEQAQEPIVDPALESERLRTNKDTGKPVTEGDTPTKDTTPKSVIDQVF